MSGKTYRWTINGLWGSPGVQQGESSHPISVLLHQSGADRRDVCACVRHGIIGIQVPWGHAEGHPCHVVRTSHDADHVIGGELPQTNGMAGHAYQRGWWIPPCDRAWNWGANARAEVRGRAGTREEKPTLGPKGRQCGKWRGGQSDRHNPHTPDRSGIHPLPLTWESHGMLSNNNQDFAMNNYIKYMNNRLNTNVKTSYKYITTKVVVR